MYDLIEDEKIIKGVNKRFEKVLRESMAKALPKEEPWVKWLIEVITIKA